MNSGLAIETMITILTPRFIPYFMLLLVIGMLQVPLPEISDLLTRRIVGNVSVCSYPIELLPTIYRYGYAAPFYNVSHAARSIIFGTKNTRTLVPGVIR
jgi:Protein of unknown function (DUF3533)